MTLWFVARMRASPAVPRRPAPSGGAALVSRRVPPLPAASPQDCCTSCCTRRAAGPASPAACPPDSRRPERATFRIAPSQPSLRGPGGDLDAGAEAEAVEDVGDVALGRAL